VISFRDIVVGILIGAANTSWFGVFLSSLGWGFVAWFTIVLLGGRAEYKLGSVLFFGSPSVTRFIVWWTTAFATSLTGVLTYGARQFF
jgi:hypothetical protein